MLGWRRLALGSAYRKGHSLSYRWRYAAVGAGFGAVFPVVALTIDGYLRSRGGATYGPIELHLSNPLHFIIDTAPLFLGWFASLAGQREDRLRAMQMTLQQHVDELSRAVRRAQSADRAKSEFLTNTSHELRTPMNGILGYCQLLQDTGLSAQQREYLGIVEGCGKTLVELVDGILDLARIESGRLALSPEPTDLRLVAREVGAVIEPLLETKDVVFEASVENDVPDRLLVDRARIKQVLLNLTANAVKFTEHGRIGLHIGASRDAGKLILAVSDTGCGIPDDQLAQVFDRFYQVESHAAREHGGAGLGLTIVAGIVNAMGGSVAAESDFGRGTTFTIELPLTQCAAPPPSSAQSQIPDALLLRADGRVLVAEDNLVNQKLAERMLASLGLACDVVPDGRAAVEAALQGDYALILMDLQMPILGGIEATRELRARGYVTPIIAMTANAMKIDRDRCLEAGMQAVLTKPTDRDDLAAVLEEYGCQTSPVC